MDEQTKQAAANALDNALTTVAVQEYNRLALNLDLDQRVESIKGALNSLSRLYIGEMPDYNEWDALFYHWYQPSHINLAYSLIKSALADEFTTNDKLRVVDFGCGALAMQFGVAFAAADTLEQMQPLSEIRIDSLDTSESMINMGQQIWEQFIIEVNRDSRLRYISLACEIINSQTTILTRNPLMFEFNRHTAWTTAWQCECWVSALHTVYDANKDTVQQWLSAIVNRLHPSKCFATTHSSKYDLLQEVWNFMDLDAYHIPMLTIEPQFRGVLPKITRWRKNLNSALQIDHSYLDRNVTWDRNIIRKRVDGNKLNEEFDAGLVIHHKGYMPVDADDLPW